ncbi:hypothetical protein JTE90_012059 [Oedothorax gibbosus]|uniref:Uncharacterized protein n=1 Tax=Oedothorax gibbosus TaxID=931172 RepID=A0AAV6TEA5_9ARAC|nr:hypothetical protein JTE90_012059 [Oedothorax gibbosus]
MCPPRQRRPARSPRVRARCPVRRALPPRPFPPAVVRFRTFVCPVRLTRRLCPRRRRRPSRQSHAAARVTRRRPSRRCVSPARVRRFVRHSAACRVAVRRRRARRAPASPVPSRLRPRRSTLVVVACSVAFGVVSDSVVAVRYAARRVVASAASRRSRPRVRLSRRASSASYLSSRRRRASFRPTSARSSFTLPYRRTFSRVCPRRLAVVAPIASCRPASPSSSAVVARFPRVVASSRSLVRRVASCVAVRFLRSRPARTRVRRPCRRRRSSSL